MQALFNGYYFDSAISNMSGEAAQISDGKDEKDKKQEEEAIKPTENKAEGE